MKYIFNLLIIMFIFSACSDNTKVDKFTDLEIKLKEKYDSKIHEELFKLYDEALIEYADDTAKVFEIIGKKAMFLQSFNKVNKSIDLLKNTFEKYGAGEKSKSNMLLLGGLYMDRLKDSTSAYTVYQIFKSNFQKSKEIELVNKRLPNNLPNLHTRIKELGNSIYKNDQNRVDYKAAKLFINSCELIPLLKPDDKKAIDYLFYAGEASKNFKLSDKALSNYDKIIEKYPNNPKTEMAYFMKGFIYDTDKKDFEKAKVYYDKYLEIGTDSNYIQSVRFLLDKLGMSNDEIIKSFEKKN